jgi:prepilin-type N-terminal cleavage/methylation domain-containing protein
MCLPRRADKRGMTMVELLVALALSSLIIIMISGLYLFSSKLLVGFQTRSYFNDQRILLETALTEKLGRLEHINQAGEKLLSFAAFNGSKTSLEASSDGNLLLDGRQLLPAGFKFDNFSFKYFGRKRGESGYRLFDAEDLNGNFALDGEELESIVLVELWYMLSYKDMSREFKLDFFPRSKL